MHGLIPRMNAAPADLLMVLQPRSLLPHVHNLFNSFPQTTTAFLIMFPWGEWLLIGKESGEIKEHWLLKS